MVIWAYEWQGLTILQSMVLSSMAVIQVSSFACIKFYKHNTLLGINMITILRYEKLHITVFPSIKLTVELMISVKA